MSISKHGFTPPVRQAAVEQASSCTSPEGHPLTTTNRASESPSSDRALEQFEDEYPNGRLCGIRASSDFSDHILPILVGEAKKEAEKEILSCCGLPSLGRTRKADISTHLRDHPSLGRTRKADLSTPPRDHKQGPKEAPGLSPEPPPTGSGGHNKIRMKRFRMKTTCLVPVCSKGSRSSRD